jgi:glycosyltransferase involved in cell wall biosynthesis
VLYGGIERIVDFLVEEFSGMGIQITLVAHRESKWAEILEPWPTYRSQHPIDFLRNTFHLAKVWNQKGPFDLVHSFSRLAYLIPLFQRNVPMVQSYQRHVSHRSVKWGTFLAGDRLSFSACSNYLANAGRVGSEKWETIYNGVRLKNYNFVEKVSEDAPLVFLGRMERIKGPHHAIKIALKAGKRLVLAGNRAEIGDEAIFFEKEISPFLKNPTIQYIGPVNDVQKNELLGKASALLFPIEWEEPFGIVMAEALACGTPVIALSKGAVPEVVQNGVTGWISTHLEELENGVLKLNRISRKTCRVHAEKCFSSDKIAYQYFHMYQQLLKES